MERVRVDLDFASEADSHFCQRVIEYEKATEIVSEQRF